ncbi:BTAD domain-containing putative transcriptional regulator [Streptomyces griseiscabiei]|uniref:BTAD domain-containing putative transcriptional regulator n=1 Tax=Streptomyces griseiscabiei TaxID=2993540 RepID=A0ABU4KZY4_9ACTN|nr:BTAD domain-containing putative transcriptional regulator [Streptomyces griseiscabiei]MBZ3900880.1 tetratricopeptide repeat protein [Streptomyces griseiscabiei]MDX2908991.1 BTAD domain-containing putative transcriptional regulator [Streptomyces griseiscabiei]
MGRTPEQLGAWLRERRTRLGLSQPRLAELAGVSVRAIREIEHGRARSSHSPTVLRLLAALGSDGEPGPLDSPPFQLGILGPLTLMVTGRHTPPGAAKQSTLLALLGLHPGAPVSLDEIVDILWDDRPPASSLNMVHTYVARLRRLLAAAVRPGDSAGGPLLRTRTGYALDLDEHRSDAARFAVLAVLPEGTDEAYAQAEAALRLWRGAVLQDMPSRLREHPSAVTLTRLRLSVLQAYADSALAAGTTDNAVGELRRAADLEPLHEGVHARLMLALAASGEQAAALGLYTALRDRLDDQLGVRPGPELTDAHLRVLRMDLPHTATTRALAAPAPAPVPALLPYDAAYFTGRTDQLARLDALLDGAGPEPGRGGGVLCALTGVAGAGKTALAVHWAHRVRDRFPDGQLFVDLRGHAQGAPLRPVEALARFLLALGVAPERVPGSPEAAADLYRTLAAGRRMLVVLDNAADPDQIRPLLPGGPGCLVLVTSRDRLAGLAARDGARRIALDVLSAEESRLLLVRTLGRARVDADPRAAADLARACGHLPLALRITAANLDHTPVRTLREQADELGEGDRLTALSVTGDRSTAVRAAFDHSYYALDAPVRWMFRVLALLPGPETGLRAAAVVAGTTPEEAAALLDRLTAAHLLREHRPGRYRCHDLVALYAAERLRATESEPDRRAARRRLYDWLVAVVDRCAQLLYPGQQRLLPRGEGGGPDAAVASAEIPDARAAIRWLDTELANVAAAVRQAAVENHPAAWLLPDALRGYTWTRKLAVDWTALGEAALSAARAAGQPLAQGTAHNILGIAYIQQGRPEAAIAHFEQMLALAEAVGAPAVAATAHTNLSMVTRISGRLRRSAEHLERAMEIDRRNGLPDGHPVVLAGLSHVLRDLGRLSESLDHMVRADTLARSRDSRHNQIHRQAALGQLLNLLGDRHRAAAHLDAALSMARESADVGSEAHVLRLRASAHRDTGDLARALELATAATELSDQDVDDYFRAAARVTLGSVLLALGRNGEAAHVYREALKQARDRGAYDLEARALLGLASVPDPADRQQAERALALARRTEYVLVEGEALLVLARAALQRGEPAVAAAHAHEALALHRTAGHRKGEAQALDLLERAVDATREGAGGTDAEPAPTPPPAPPPPPAPAAVPPATAGTGGAATPCTP